ncbi:hypothetical protein ACFX2F_000826 [Malus domestica]
MAIYIVSRWAAGVSTPLPALRFATSLRPYSTKFREERDTFGPSTFPQTSCGGRRLRDHCRILILAASESECPNPLSVLLGCSKNALQR